MPWSINRDAIAHAHGLDLVVRNVDGGRAHLLLELLQLVARACAQLGVEIGQRLVEQEYGGLRTSARASATRWRSPPESWRGLPLKQAVDAEQAAQPNQPCA